MFQPIALGQLFGIPLRVRWSFVGLMAFVLLLQGGVSGLVFLSLVFASVVAHELGHALVARRLGVDTRSIELHFFGGVAQLDRSPKNARDEILIALAGPLVSLLLAFGLWASSSIVGSSLLSAIAVANGVLAVFNLLPAFPMDGGRVLRAFFATRESFATATGKAVKVSRGVSALMGLVAVVTGQWQFLIIAGVVWMLASAEARRAPYSVYSHESWHPYASGPRSAPGLVAPAELFSRLRELQRREGRGRDAVAREPLCRQRRVYVRVNRR